ncbi:MAG: hypothetical protein ACFFCW_04250 [Candidatus Hodarchaeota archaeon]
MADQFTVPEKFDISIQRILPYLAAPLQKNPQVLESLLLYMKLGGEKMARIAIDALNVTQRLEYAEPKKQLREQEQELLNVANQDSLNDEQDEKEEENGDRFDDAEPNSLDR